MGRKRKEISPKDFKHNNFIEEVKPKELIRSDGKIELCRQVKLKCIECNCEFIALLNNALKNGAYCGVKCSRKQFHKVEGGSMHHPLRSKWLNMIQRCTNPNNTNYPHYGGRGITVEEYLTEFSNYVSYVMSLPSAPSNFPTKLEIDRINNDSNYERGNLRWATRSTQVTNKRPSRKRSGNYTNIYWCNINKNYQVKFKINGKNINVGRFKTEEEARQARNQFIINNNLVQKIE